MSFLDQNFDDVSEPKSVKEGEYQVRVLDAAVKTSQKGKGDYVNLRLEILDDPQAKDINHVMMIPGPGDDAKQRNKRLFAIQSFLKACGFDPATTENVQEVIGATCWAILVEEQDPEYGTQNRVRKFVVGK
jgi:hypothetical protein